MNTIIDNVSSVGIAILLENRDTYLWHNECFTMFVGLLPPDFDIKVVGKRVVTCNNGYKFSVICEMIPFQPQQMTVIIEDISEEHHSLRNIVKVIDASTDGYWDWNMQTGDEFMSAKFWGTLGYKPGNVHELKSWMKLIHPDDLTKVENNLKHHLADPHNVPYYNLVRYMHREGHDVSVICRGSIVEWDDEGNPVRMVGTHTDISQFLNTMSCREDEGLLERKAMVNYVFHEVRNPINTISTGIALLKQEMKAIPQNKNILDLVFTMNRAVKRAVGVLGDTLEYSKLENGCFSLKLGEHNLVNIINNVVGEFEIQANDLGINLVTSFFTRKVNILCDDLRMRQILNNVLSNAIKFTPAGGTITLSLKVDKETIGIVVSDTGMGIPNDQLEEIFQPYKQLNPNNGLNGGMGLGLTICKKLVQAHHGTIKASSEEGTGTTFTISLPNSDLQNVCERINTYVSKTSSDEDDDMDEIHFNGGNVLVVEDDPINRTLLTKLLRGKGLSVITAKDGREFVDMVSNNQTSGVDLVILDELMPRMNGTVGLRIAREEFGFNKPVAFLTGSDLHEHRQKCKLSGSTEILTKPVNMMALNNVLMKYMPRNVCDR